MMQEQNVEQQQYLRLKKLTRKLFEALQQGNFENGITAFGIDEGGEQMRKFSKRMAKEYAEITGELIILKE